VAEGVEDEHTMNQLAELGCNIAQGFHISRPVPPQEFAEWLAERGGVATTARDVA
jgi:EAL domain-containing protein (putative c-di-GMP-specific phosphodiesterase class I)